MKVLGSWPRSHPFRALALAVALIVLSVVLGEVIGGVGGFLVRLVVHLPAIMLGIAFLQAGRR